MSGPRVGAPPALHTLTCTFRDAELETEFRQQSFERNLIQSRIAHVLGILLWVVWGLLVRGDLGPDKRLDLEMRYGIFIPIILVSLAFSFTSVYRRVWQEASAAAILATGFAWISYVSLIDAMPIDYGYVGVILIMTFSYTLMRVPFLLALAVSGALVVGYLVISLATNELTSATVKLPLFYLLSFFALGMVAAYLLDRAARLLFLRERELDRERGRSESLLLNVLPQAIVERLKQREEEAGETRIADGIEQATVLFIDAVGFTVEAARTPPDMLVGALDELFSRFDAIADQFGLEKIKTIGGRPPGGRGSAAAATRPCRGRRHNGAGGAGCAPRDALALGKSHRGADGDREWAARCRCHRPPKVPLRPVGRHGEPRQPPRIPRRVGPDPRVRGGRRPNRRRLPLHSEHRDRNQGQGPDERSVPPRPKSGRDYASARSEDDSDRLMTIV
jgi:class 3 adenylate cyclase